MRFFDARLDPSLRSDDDLANLAYFGCEAALIAMPDSGPVDTAAELLGTFEHLLEVEEPRVRRAGLEPLVMLGVDAASRPRRSHPEVLAALDQLARDAALAAVGPLDLDDEASLLAQLEIAAEHGLPAVVRLVPESGAAPVERALAAARRIGETPPRLVFDRCDYTNLRAALGMGAGVVVDVSPGGFGADGLDMLVRFGEQAQSRAMLASAGGPALDVIAIPRAAVRLREAGLGHGEIDRLVHGNATTAFGRNPPR